MRVRRVDMQAARQTESATHSTSRTGDASAPWACADQSQVPSRTPDGVGDTQHQLHRHGVCRVAHWRTITLIVRCESATAAQPRQTSPAAVSVLLELTMTAVE